MYRLRDYIKNKTHCLSFYEPHKANIIYVEDKYTIRITTSVAIDYVEKLLIGNVKKIFLTANSEQWRAIDVIERKYINGIEIISEKKGWIDDFTSKIVELQPNRDILKQDSPHPKEALDVEPTDKESLTVDKVEPVSLYDFFLTSDCCIDSEDEYTIDLTVNRFTKRITATFNTAHSSVSRDVDIHTNGYLDRISIGTTCKKQENINGIWIFYNYQPELDYICASIKELQPKAEKLTRKELVILDRAFNFVNDKDVSKSIYAFNYKSVLYSALSIVAPDLRKEVYKAIKGKKLRPYIDYIMADPNDYDVLKHISKAIERQSND